MRKNNLRERITDLIEPGKLKDLLTTLSIIFSYTADESIRRISKSLLDLLTREIYRPREDKPVKETTTK